MAERMGGSSWENLIEKELFDPLGMRNSSFFTTFSPDLEDIAIGYVQHDGVLHPVSFEFLRYINEISHFLH
jgi:CubicO group peptidase (beta-lactamase class C family)